MLRQFLYLDRDLVRDFLAQVEGGVYDESRERHSAEGRRGVTGKAGVGPVALSGDRNKTTQAESESVVKQTAASEFDRLYSHLEAAGLQVYDVVDAELDALPIRRKDVIEVDARLRLSGLKSMVDMMGSLGRLAPLMSALGADTGIDDSTMSGIQAMAALAGSGDTPIWSDPGIARSSVLESRALMRRSSCQGDTRSSSVARCSI